MPASKLGKNGDSRDNHQKLRENTGKHGENHQSAVPHYDMIGYWEAKLRKTEENWWNKPLKSGDQRDQKKTTPGRSGECSEMLSSCDLVPIRQSDFLLVIPSRKSWSSSNLFRSLEYPLKYPMKALYPISYPLLWWLNVQKIPWKLPCTPNFPDPVRPSSSQFQEAIWCPPSLCAPLSEAKKTKVFSSIFSDFKRAKRSPTLASR